MWVHFERNLRTVCWLGFFFFKENCFPLIKLEFIPLKLTCHRAQQAGKGSPAGPGNSSNAPINCSWTRKNGTSHNRLTDSMCALRCFCFYFYGCSSWCREIPVTFQLSFSEKRRQEVSTSNWGWDWKRGPLRLGHEEVSKGISGWHNKPISRVLFWVLASWFWEARGWLCCSRIRPCCSGLEGQLCRSLTQVIGSQTHTWNVSSSSMWLTCDLTSLEYPTPGSVWAKHCVYKNIFGDPALLCGNCIIYVIYISVWLRKVKLKFHFLLQSFWLI